MSIRGRQFWKIVSLVGIVIAGMAAPAMADPITVDSGSLRLFVESAGSFRVGGDGFQSFATLGADDGYGPRTGCFSSAALCGTQFGFSISDSLSGDDLGGGFLVGADRYILTAFSYSFVAGPATPPPPNAEAVVTAPFTFTGSMTGTLNGTSRTIALNGSGIVSGQYLADPGWLASTYDFTPASATPEPASMILLGTGLAGVYAQRRRRAGRPVDQPCASKALG